MASLTIISGTYHFSDPFQIFTREYGRNLRYRYVIDGVKFKKRRFDRVIINQDGNVLFLPPVIAPMNGYQTVFSVVQTMGSGKTILGVEHLARAHINGRKTDANMSLAWHSSNRDKPKSEWRPSLNSLEDFENASYTTILFDDIKGTISKWNAKEADFLSSIVNASRKEGKDIIITTQRVVNFVPPNIREVATNYEIPYITIRDMRKPSPDKMGMPIEMEVFNISANDVFLGFGLYNGIGCDNNTLQLNEKLLNAYSTLEIAQDLKSTSSKKKSAPSDQIEFVEPYVGYNNEVKVVQELRKYNGIITHLAQLNPREHDSDIELIDNGKRYLIDVVAVLKDKYKKPRLATTSKDFIKITDISRKSGTTHYIAFNYKNGIKLLDMEYLRGSAGHVTYTKELKAKSVTPYAVFNLKPK